jgi:hypothetical protein
MIQYSPRSPNSAKAMANWEKKSAYLLREIVKFKTYTDSLTVAQQRKAELDKEREEREKETEKQRQQDGEDNTSFSAEPPTNGSTNGLHAPDQPARLSDSGDGSIQHKAPIIRTERPSVDFDNSNDSDDDMDKATMEAIKASRNASPVDMNA